jgi:hypothetical protein
MTNIFVKVDLDEKNSRTHHNTKLVVSNPKTLMGTTTHQEARDVMALIWHDVNYE